MKKKDLNKIAAIEKAIKQKYGDKAIINPNSNWNKTKEQRYNNQLKELAKKQAKQDQQKQKVEKEGFFVSKQLLTREESRACPVCEIYSFDTKVDIYFRKFECCYKCYVKWIEDREGRWESGWRPNKEE